MTFNATVRFGSIPSFAQMPHDGSNRNELKKSITMRYNGLTVKRQTRSTHQFKQEQVCVLLLIAGEQLAATLSPARRRAVVAERDLHQ